MPLDEGVIRTEAAGAFAALIQCLSPTGQKSYLNGALWSPWLSATTDQESIPWVATPYGTYIAARVNVELGTEYDIQKFTTWSFDRNH